MRVTKEIKDWGNKNKQISTYIRNRKMVSSKQSDTDFNGKTERTWRPETKRLNKDARNGIEWIKKGAVLWKKRYQTQGAGTRKEKTKKQKNKTITMIFCVEPWAISANGDRKKKQ